MWRHLKERNKQDDEANHLPVKRYYTVVAWLAGHAFIDVLALLVYAASKSGSSSISPRLQYFLQYFSTTMFAYHVAFYPVVYVLVRDLKFHDQLKKRELSNQSSAVKEVVKKIFRVNTTNSTSRNKSNTGSNIKSPGSIKSPVSVKPVVHEMSEWTEEKLLEDKEPESKKAPVAHDVSEWTADMME